MYHVQDPGVEGVQASKIALLVQIVQSVNIVMRKEECVEYAAMVKTPITSHNTVSQNQNRFLINNNFS